MCVLLSEVNILLMSLSCYHTSDAAVGDASSFGSDPFICALWVADACNYTKHAWYQCRVKWITLEREKKYDYHIGFNWTTFCLSSRLHMQTQERDFRTWWSQLVTHGWRIWDKRPASSYFVWHCLKCPFVYIVLCIYFCFKSQSMESGCMEAYSASLKKKEKRVN